jgi:hypothetical protein
MYSIKIYLGMIRDDLLSIRIRSVFIPRKMRQRCGFRLISSWTGERVHEVMHAFGALLKFTQLVLLYSSGSYGGFAHYIILFIY